MHPIIQKKCFIFDLDGTVYLGDQPIAGTISFIRTWWNKKDFYFLTNNTSKNLDAYLHKLNALGIPASIDQILSPLLPLVDYMQAHAISRVYPVGNQAFTGYIKKHMPTCTVTDDSSLCQAVLLAYDTELTYEKLRTSCLLLQHKHIAFLATHPDKTCPSPQGPLPDTGSFLALYEAATGRKPDVVFGKPNTIMLARLLNIYDRESMVMIGDRLYTDMVLAKNAGIDSILVLSGESTQEDVDGCPDKPTWVLPDLGEIEEDRTEGKNQ
ncbi:MAG: HAD-IIA family hydrolase [Desulfoplanes sp.]|nr:HAD-IIA family hydrolase [Desulfoplanes sp.]